MAWSEIRGQQLAVTMLQTDLAKQRVAAAYLFTGPEGVGKRLVASELAKALNCERFPEGPCDRCGSCQRITRQAHPDFHLLSPKGASETVRIDDVRQVVGRVALRPFMARMQVVIVDGADRLTEEAANSFLKVLEEPPGQARFILLTAQPAACLPTIVSRCRVIRFQRLAAPLIEERLIHAHQCDPKVAQSVSRLAQGSLSTAIKLAAEWPAYQAIMAQAGSERPMTWLEWTIPNDRQELSRWLAAAVWWLRDVSVASVAGESLLHHADAAGPIRRQAHVWDREAC
ncbi:MAG: DNA polymerase III subunit delta', partial [Candidatus Omnitrophica bacterium]|nr:DNA polymerase III subunit delta' [Candidatus Omnitrophota bacterium]